MKIQAITIDFWNTIFDSSNGVLRNELRRNTFLKETEALGVKIGDEQFKESLSDAWAYFNEQWTKNQKTPNSADMVGFLWEKFKSPKSPTSIERIVEVFEESVLTYPPRINHGFLNVAPELEKISDLAIISDTGFSPGRILRTLLNSENILHYFAAFSFSDETGYAKPNPKAFDTALNALNADNSYSIHIGDIERTDIVGAKTIGMKAVKYKGDKTSIYAKAGETTIADYETDSWEDILNWIKDIAE
jgi:putative hydrolase of the HAD superfamily